MTTGLEEDLIPGPGEKKGARDAARRPWPPITVLAEPLVPGGN
jgi:hypothetical protein